MVMLDCPFESNNVLSLSKKSSKDRSSKKVTELSKELELRQAEYASNIKEKENRCQRVEIKLVVKEDQVKQLDSEIKARDRQI